KGLTLYSSPEGTYAIVHGDDARRALHIPGIHDGLYHWEAGPGTLLLELRDMQENPLDVHVALPDGITFPREWVTLKQTVGDETRYFSKTHQISWVEKDGHT